MLIVTRNRDSNVSSERAEGSCTGEMWRDVLQQANGMSVSKNFFAPCARTHWHSHEGGQLLIVESGEGFVATADELVRMSTGDMIWTPPNTRHWHGGSHDRSMLHLAVSFGMVNWEEEVSVDSYEAARGVV